MTSTELAFTARIVRIAPLVEDVLGFWMRRDGGQDLPPVAPGGSVRLTTPGGFERHYSLVNGPHAADELMIAVQLEQEGRGGSREMFALREGDELPVTMPTNTFDLDLSEERFVFIAGGIGITPIWSMIQHAEGMGRPWELHYGSRSAKRAAYLEELLALEERAPGRIHMSFSDEGQRLDLDGIVGAVGPGAGIYCCGPERITQSVEACAAAHGVTAHLEDFSVAGVAAGGFEVQLARSELSLFVPDGSTILDVILEAGVDTDYSCMSGTCGSCETKILSGSPDHQDFMLTDEEKEAGDRMMICCSGCLSGPLVLDL